MARAEFKELPQESPDVHSAVAAFKVAMERGYLRGKFFQIVADGTRPDAVRAFLEGPFAEMRAPFSKWLATAIARFPDQAETEALAHNLSDEFGEEPGRPSHAALYRRVLDELGVAVEKGQLSKPAASWSEAARNLQKACENIVATKTFPYILGFFAGFEATDGPDFERMGVAMKRMWPDRPDLHEFFVTHATSEHDSKFVSNLDPLFQQNKPEFLQGMQDFLELWEKFYEQTEEEIGLN